MGDNVNFVNVRNVLKLQLRDHAKNVQTGRGNKVMVANVELIVVIQIKNFRLMEPVKINVMTYRYPNLMVPVPIVNHTPNQQ